MQEVHSGAESYSQAASSYGGNGTEASEAYGKPKKLMRAERRRRVIRQRIAMGVPDTELVNTIREEFSSFSFPISFLDEVGRAIAVKKLHVLARDLHLVATVLGGLD